MIFNENIDKNSTTSHNERTQESMSILNATQTLSTDNSLNTTNHELNYPIELITRSIDENRTVNVNNIKQLKEHSDYIKIFFEEQFAPTNRIQSLHKEIIDYFISKGCTFTKEFNLEKITAKNQPLEYICNCETLKHKAFKEILSRNCRECQNDKLKKLPEEATVVTPLNPREVWKPVEGGFISSLGRCCNVFGKLLTSDEKGRYYIAGKSQYASILLATGFQIKNYNMLDGKHCQYVVRNKTKKLIPELDDVYIGTRSEVGEENGKKSHKSERFQEQSMIHPLEHSDKFKSIENLPELPAHVLFEDGNIYSLSCGRFLTFSRGSEKGKTYYTLCLAHLRHKVHRLICYAFHPIEGKTCLKDYEDLEVNHIDGNTLNNHRDNLEWTTHGENMKHSYDTGLNKKIREIEQYVKKEDGTQGEKIESFKSLAEASRQTGVREHIIREFARNKSRNGEFFWKYANEEQNEEFSRRFSSRR